MARTAKNIISTTAMAKSMPTKIKAAATKTNSKIRKPTKTHPKRMSKYH